MATSAQTPAAHHVILSSAEIARSVALGRVPAGRELFQLSAAVIDGARGADTHAIQLGLDAAAGLLKSIPTEAKWEECRGHLTATMEFAWLLLPQEHGAPTKSDRYGAKA